MKAKIFIGIAIAAVIALIVVKFAMACYIPPVECEVDCGPTPTVEVTPSPEASPEPSIIPEVQGISGAGDVPSNPSTNTTEAPGALVCTGILPDQPIGRPDLYKKTGTTSAHFEFFGGNADHYEVEYKYSANGFTYGIPGGLPGTSTAFDLNDLKPGFSTLIARVHAFRGGCELISEWFN